LMRADILNFSFTQMSQLSRWFFAHVIMTSRPLKTTRGSYDVISATSWIFLSHNCHSYTAERILLPTWLWRHFLWTTRGYNVTSTKNTCFSDKPTVSAYGGLTSHGFVHSHVYETTRTGSLFLREGILSCAGLEPGTCRQAARSSRPSQ
jgi:hypothetical protein